MAVKILLVEDEEAIRKFTKINLEMEGWTIFEAESGEEGIEVARKNRPDIAVLDLMLPGISGYEVCEKLRNEMPFIGIIMLTAKSQEVDRILGLEKGTDDYMIKPFNPHELVLRIKSILRRIWINKDEKDIKDNRNLKEEGPFSLDLDARLFYREGKELDLTPTELAIINLFFDNVGKALSRDRILEEIWGEDYDGETKIVDVNIRRIRAKIEDNPAKPKYLETVWGVGYRWKERD